MKKIISFFIIFLLLTGCGSSEINNDQLNIITSNFPAYDFARQIAGEEANITLLLPPGADSHSFEPTPKDIININNCDLFICNGGESESWVETIIDAGETKNIVKMLSYAEVLYTDEGFDEHVWCSPVNAGNISQAIYENLCAVDPDNIEYYTENYKRFNNDLDALNNKFKDIVENSDNKTIIFADRFPIIYFTEEYGLTHHSAFPGCSEDAEPSASDASKIIDEVKQNNIPAVFYIEFSNQKIADVVCEDTGCDKLLFHSCHNISKDDFNSGETYVSIMNKNAENLRKALK